MKESNFDTRKGLENTNPGWYTFEVRSEQFEWEQYIERYIDIVHWLYGTIAKCERHVVWGTTWSGRTMIIRFRHEKDYLHFMLRWS